MRSDGRHEWISYLRVSTPEQAERDLSLPAQRRAVEDYAARHHAGIAREYLEAGCSGTSSKRKAFRQMLSVVSPDFDGKTGFEADFRDRIRMIPRGWARAEA